MMKAEKAHMERVARASGVQIVGKLEDISDLMQDEDGDDSWDDEPDPPPRPIRNYLSQKSRSLERGGSLRPPPRQNSIKNVSQITDLVIDIKWYERITDLKHINCIIEEYIFVKVDTIYDY